MSELALMDHRIHRHVLRVKVAEMFPMGLPGFKSKGGIITHIFILKTMSHA